MHAYMYLTCICACTCPKFQRLVLANLLVYTDTYIHTHTIHTYLQDQSLAHEQQSVTAMMGTRPVVLSDIEGHSSSIAACLDDAKTQIAELAGTQGQNWRELISAESVRWLAYADGYVWSIWHIDRCI